jgi:transketolase
VCVDAAKQLSADGIAARVVSMPSWELFAMQPQDYIDAVLPPGLPRLAVEAGVPFGWERWANATVTIDHFGASAPGAEALAHFGFTPDNVAAHARELLAANRSS